MQSPEPESAAGAGAGSGRRSVAIVVPVLNEADNLDALLDDCAGQSPPPDEVVVVDAGSTDGSLELLTRRRRAWPNLTVLAVPGATPGRGRNAGIEHTEAELVATLDAGSRVDRSWLATLLGGLDGREDERLVVGATVADARSSFERAAGWFTLRAFKPAGRRPAVGSDFAGRNGFAFSRVTWRAGGGYPPDLPWGEDKVFLGRVREAGREVVAVPEAVVRWRPRRSLRELFRQYERYGRGDALAGVDRRNELIAFGLYGCGGLLAAAGLRGHRWATVTLGLGAVAYLGLFVVAASRDISVRDLRWVPLLRVCVDVAKMQGFLAATFGSEARPAGYANLRGD